jgi:hypothetical protein
VRSEAATVADIFFEALPMSLDVAREKASNWTSESADIVIKLRIIKNLSSPMHNLHDHLDKTRLGLVEQWLALLPLLP